MASNYKKPPVFAQDRTWKEGDIKHIDKAKIAGRRTKEEVYTYGGKKGMEFLVSKTSNQVELGGVLRKLL